MRLIIVGAPDGRLAEAARLAAKNGANVRFADGVAAALGLLSAGGGADVVVVDAAAVGVRDLVDALAAGSWRLPVIAWGSDADGTVAVEARAAGACEYLPLPATAEAIAALMTALAAGDRDDARAAPRSN